MAFAFDQRAHRNQRRPGQPQGRAGGFTLERTEDLRIHAIPQNRDFLARRAQPQQRRAQSGADGDDGGGTGHRVQNQPPRRRMIGELRHIRAARGQHHGEGELRPQPHRRDTVGIEVVGIDGVEPRAFRQQAAKGAPAGLVQQERREIHAEPWNDGKARVIDGQPVPALPRRHPRIGAPAAECRRPAGEERHRRQHRAHRLAGRHQMAQPVLDENAVVRLLPVGKQGGERQQPQRRHC